jgi:hypothetical protein
VYIFVYPRICVSISTRLIQFVLRVVAFLFGLIAAMRNASLVASKLCLIGICIFP